MHPQQRVRPRRLERALGEPLVRDRVVVPPAPVDDDAVGKPVEERPERSVGEAVVVALDLGLAERHRHEPGGEVGERVRDSGRAAVPADPRAGPGLEHRAERRNEPAVGRPPAAARLHDRQAVGDRHDRRRRRLAGRPDLRLRRIGKPTVCEPGRPAGTEADHPGLAFVTAILCFRSPARRNARACFRNLGTCDWNKHMSLAGVGAVALATSTCVLAAMIVLGISKGHARPLVAPPLPRRADGTSVRGRRCALHVVGVSAPVARSAPAR